MALDPASRGAEELVNDSHAMRIVAIHQPNFFPWLGYFDKIARCDRFVSLDHVQLPGASGSWVNRVKLLVAGEPKWVTAPVTRPQVEQSIAKTRFDERGPWRRKLVSTLEASYRKAPHFEEAFALLAPLIRNEEASVADYNLRATIAVAAALGLDTSKIRRSSDLGAAGSSNELLVNLTRQVGGNAYMHGNGAGGYRDDGPFLAAGIAPREQNFAHPVYAQHGRRGDFVPGLSIIDALMNAGVAGTAAMIAGEAGR